MSHTEVGLWGEQIAKDYLLRHGYKIIAQRWRALRGDIDLIAQDGDKVVFVEVKTRRGKHHRQGIPEEAVTWQKQRQLIRLAQLFMSRYDPKGNTACRIDMIALEVAISTKTVRLRHHASAVQND